MPGLLRCDRGDYARVLHLISHARLRVHWAPGIPCALVFLEGRCSDKNSGASRRGIAKACREYERATFPVVIARLDRAIKYSKDASDGIERPRRTGCE
jgi:hypothetical protein